VAAYLLEPFGDPVDDDDLVGAEEHRGSGGHLSDAAGSPDGDGVAGGDAGEVCSGPAGGGGVGREQGRQVRHPVGDGESALVGVRDANVLGVAAGKPAQGVTEAKQPPIADPHIVSVNAGVGLPLSHSEYSSWVQYQHCPQATNEHTTTRSPTRRFFTADPISTTSPMNS